MEYAGNTDKFSFFFRERRYHTFMHISSDFTTVVY
jgi:hypothetical protein